MISQSKLAPVPDSQDVWWRAVLERNRAFDNQFFYAVKTTGVYCRPSCAARMAKQENILFFMTREDAERSGFRPCKRCKPDEPWSVERNAEMVADICRCLAQSKHVPSLKELADKTGISQSHFHRLFKAITGVTPRAFASAHRAERIRHALTKSGITVTGAIYDAGFNSSSRFYEKSNRILGMTPSSYRKGGKDIEIGFAIGSCSLGSILVASSGEGICAIFMGDNPDALTRDLQERFPHARLVGGDPGFEALVAKVIGFVEEPALGLDLPLDIRGTAFQLRVWQALQEIPAGSTASYADIAKRIGMPKSFRAVAGACAANPIAVAIPCHRIVRNDGALSGYRWGVARKHALQEREKKK